MFVGVAALLMHLQRFVDKPVRMCVNAPFHCSRPGIGHFLEAALKAIDSPEQVNGRGTCARQCLANRCKFGAQFRKRSRLRLLHTDSHAHRRRNADRRSAANHHVFDRARNFAVIRIGVVDHLAWKPPLVEHDDAFGRPPYGFHRAHGCRIHIGLFICLSF